jgi:transcriptional regulator with PAS, ATPase and Fis domain/Tfp pilus assembly protein PilF
MKNDSSKNTYQIGQLDLIESLVEDKKFKEALAQIREKDNQDEWDRFSCEWGWLAHLHARALQGVGRCEEALKRAQEALRIFKNTLENEKLARIQFNLGIVYSDVGDLRNSEFHFRDAASTFRRVEDKKGVIRTYNELSRICFTKGRYENAIEYLKDGLEYCKKTKDQKLTATVLGNLGTIYMISDRWEEAQESLTKSLELNRKCKRDINVCNSYLSLAYLSLLLRQFSRARSYLKKACAIIHENQLARELAIFHEYSGILECCRKDLGSARDHFQKAIEIGEEIAPDSTIISQSYRLMAEVQVEMGDYQQALASCFKSIKTSKQVGERLEEAANYRTLGRIYSQNGDLHKVKENFYQAITILEDIGIRFELAKTYQDMGRCKSFEFWERMKFLGRAEDITSKLDSPYYLAKVHIDFASLFLQNEKISAAQNFLDRAKPIFEKLGEKKELETIFSLEKQILTHQPTAQAIPVNLPTGTSDTKSYCNFDHFITQDKAIQEIIKNANQVKDLDETILLEGETGTGKDLLAKAIHFSSNRRDKKFVVVTCAAVPEPLFESELFGHKKGSFTGAVSDKKGHLHEADGGTLYLDEIAEVPLPIQVKLLRAIEEKEVVRVGEVKPKRVNFRVIAATNRDLDKLVEEGKFRSDLFYRLNVMRFKLPPLKERKEDIPLLMEHLLEKHTIAGINGQTTDQREPCPRVRIPKVDPRITELFLNYHWPGNVRELENELKRLLISSQGEDKISFEHLAGCLERFSNGDNSNEATSLLHKLAEFEKEHIRKALAQSNGVKTKAAALLNISEALLRFKMKKYNITYPPETN